jgi:hypothetical protein
MYHGGVCWDGDRSEESDATEKQHEDQHWLATEAVQNQDAENVSRNLHRA